MVPTLVEAVQLGSQYLARHGRETPRLESELMAAHALGLGRLDVYLQHERPLSQDELAQLRILLRRCASGEPVAYILGHREFHSMDFEVSPAVLIPRPETEELVDLAVREIASVWKDGSGAVICDAGTGSGCIAVSILTLLPGARAIGLDCSPEALLVAQRNAQSHGVASRLEWFCSDWLDVSVDNSGNAPSGQQYQEAQAAQAVQRASSDSHPAALDWSAVNVLLSNPPYIALTEMEGLPATVRHEPKLALAGGDDGLSAYRALLASAKRRLAVPFFGLFEVDPRRAAEVAGLVTVNWTGCKPELLPDLSGRDRFVSWWCRA